MHKNLVILLACALVLAGGVAALGSLSSGRPRLSLQFIGYTNAGYGEHVGVVQISNASPFAVLRERSPAVILDLAAPGVQSYAPTGWNVLGPGECELVRTEPLPTRTRWSLRIACEPFRGSKVGPPDFRRRVSRLAIWLRGHGLPVPEPSRHPAAQFSSGWVEP